MPALAIADDGDEAIDHQQSSKSRDGIDHDEILRLVRAGKVQPLSRIKANVLDRWPGEIVSVGIDSEDGRMIYEIRILSAAGRLIEIEADAATGKILEVENE